MSGGGSPTAPTLTSKQFGATYTPSLTGTATAYSLDNGATWSVTNPLTGSGSTERWQTSQTVSGTVSAAQTIAFTFYNQYLLTLEYTISNTPAGTPTVTNMVSYTTFGGAATATPTLALYRHNNGLGRRSFSSKTLAESSAAQNADSYLSRHRELHGCIFGCSFLNGESIIL